jgi:ketosteroid isomerase-like protein
VLEKGRPGPHPGYICAVATLDVREERNVATVRALWAGFRSGGVDQVLALVDEDVEWQPLTGGGAVMRGSEAVRRHFSDLRESGQSLEAIPHSFVANGDVVLVSGTLRRSGAGGIEERTAHWLFWLSDGKLVRAGWRSREEAERTLEQAGEQRS